MTHRNRLIALVCLEALLWLVVMGTRNIPFLPDLYLFGATFDSATVTFFQVVSAAALALALIVGMRSRAWQGAIALSLIASAPAVILLALFGRIGPNLDMALLSLVAPLAALGWFGWLLRFVRAEFAA